MVALLLPGIVRQLQLVNPKIFIDSPGLKFRIDEVSANVFVVRAIDRAGRTEEMTGTNSHQLMNFLKRGGL